MLTVSKAWRWWQPEGLPAFSSLSQYLSCAKYTQVCVRNAHKRVHTSTRVQIGSLHTVLTRYKQKTHTQERVCAFTNISLSISFWTHFSLEENYFSAGCFFFVYCAQTKALSAANHCMSNSQTCCSHLKKINTFFKKRFGDLIFSSSDCNFRSGLSPLSFKMLKSV